MWVIVFGSAASHRCLETYARTALELVSAILRLLRQQSARDDSSALIQSTSALLASLGARISIKSGRGRLSTMNSLTEKTLRNCPCEYAAWPPSCQSPTCQSPAAIRPFPDFESISWYAAISEICSQSRSRFVFCCGKHRASGEPLNPTGRAEK